MIQNDLKYKLKEQASLEGFSLMRVCRPWSLESHSERLQEFLRQNWHGEMAWMKEKVEWRSDPSSLWPKAKSCIMLERAILPIMTL